MDDLIAIIISLAGSLGGIILGAVLIHFFALKKAKADIELEGIKKLAGILAQNFDQVKKPERNKIQSLMKTINDEIINKGYGIVLTKESNILLHLIRSNIEEGKWYQIPIPEEERFVLKDLIKKPFKKYLNLKKKLFQVLGVEYYESGSLMAFCFIILEFILYLEQKTLPSTEIILSKVSNDFVITSEFQSK